MVLLAVSGLAACTGGSPAEPRSEAVVPASGDAPKPGDGLVFSGSTFGSYELHDAVVTCQTSNEPPYVEVVRLTSPPRIRHRGNRLLESFLYVEAVPGVEGTFELPLDGGDQDRRPDVTIFRVEHRSRSELSGAVETSTGTLTVLAATCDPLPRLSFTVRATLGTEAGGLASLHVLGGLSAAGEAP